MSRSSRVARSLDGGLSRSSSHLGGVFGPRCIWVACSGPEYMAIRFGGSLHWVTSRWASLLVTWRSAAGSSRPVQSSPLHALLASLFHASLLKSHISTMFRS